MPLRAAFISGIVPSTASRALEEASLPYALKLANLGFEKAVKSDKVLASGVVAAQGKATWQALEELFGIPYTPLAEALSTGPRSRPSRARSARSTR